MIPADHITFDGDTAWLVCPNEYTGTDDEAWLFLSFWHGSDRPCDTCDGMGWRPDRYNANSSLRCHCIDGRHTFEIEVEQVEPPIAPGRYSLRQVWRTYRVSIVPGMVLPIWRGHPPTEVRRFIAAWGDGWALVDRDTNTGPIIAAFPPAAKPGMWAVKLRKAA